MFKELEKKFSFGIAALVLFDEKVTKWTSKTILIFDL